MKQLLTEVKNPQRFIPTGKPQLTERADGTSAYVVEGVFGKIDMKNENNRCYPGSVFERNLKPSSGFMRRLESRSVLGELEHPESGNTHLERVSHLLTKVWTERLDGDRAKALNIPEGLYVMGRMELLNTPRGNILKALYEAGVNVGVSSRGRGDVKSIGGVDIVQDDYELDTFDAVYMPSVVEARPKRVTEAQGDLGSALPDAAAAAGKETPSPTEPSVPASGAQASDWKKESEAVIRKLEAAVSSSESDIASLIELIQPAINLIDQLSALDDQEAVKVKSQATTLLRVLTSRIADTEAGKTKAKKDKENKSMEKGAGKHKEESVVTEVDFVTLANTIYPTRVKDGAKKPLYKGDVELELERAGQDVNPGNVEALANQLKAKGLTVDASKYESISEASEPEHFIDGQIVSVKAKDLNPGCDRIKAWLDKQESEVLARIGSCGKGGMVVQLIEPEVAGHDIFVEYQKAKSPVTESKENTMDAKQMMEALVKENTELKKQLKEGKTDGVPVARYTAAKKIIEGLIKRVKTSEASRIKAESKVKASIVLIHKLVNERKAKKGEKPEGNTEPKKEGKTESLASASSVVTETKITRESEERRTRLIAAGKKPVVEAAKVETQNVMSMTIKRLNG